MDTLSIIITLVSVIASVLQIVLFFKVWGMCNNITTINMRLHAADKITMNDLIKVSKINKSLFEENLYYAIHKDFASINYSDIDIDKSNKYKDTYTKWEKRCSHYGWQMPVELSQCDTWNKFCTKYLFSYSPNNIK